MEPPAYGKKKRIKRRAYGENKERMKKKRRERPTVSRCSVQECDDATVERIYRMQPFSVYIGCV